MDLRKLWKHFLFLLFLGDIFAFAAIATLAALLEQISLTNGPTAAVSVPFLATYSTGTAVDILFAGLGATFLFGISLGIQLGELQGVESKRPDSEIQSAGIRTAQPMTPASPSQQAPAATSSSIPQEVKKDEKPVHISSI